MSYAEEYQKKLTTAEEAVKVVKSGDHIDYGWTTNTPVALDQALAARMDELENLYFRGGILMWPLAISQIDDSCSTFYMEFLAYVRNRKKMVPAGIRILYSDPLFRTAKLLP